ncbi:MAG: peptidylprolyl isomerase [Dehalococcoidia bacterium]
MPKKPKAAPHRVPTTRQLSRWQREERRSRIVFALGALVILGALGVMGYGYYDSNIAPRHEPAVRVNDTILDLDYFIGILRMNVTLFGGAENPLSLVGMTIEQIQDRELVRQEAAKPEFDVRISAREIDDTIRETISPQPAEGEEPITLTETEYQERYREVLKNMGLTEAVHRGIVEHDLRWGQMRTRIQSRVPTEAEHIHLHLILLDTLEEAEDAAVRLADGEDFAAVAQELSQDEVTQEKGGDLGWVPRGAFPVVEDTAFALEPGTVSEPVETPEGYYLLMVSEEHQVRTIADNYLDGMKSDAIGAWMEEKREDALRDAFLNTRRLNWVAKQFN